LNIKKYKISIGYGIGIVVLHFAQFQVESVISRTTGTNFATYFIYAVFLSFFLVMAVKTVISKKTQDIALALLSIGLTLFFLMAHPVFIFKLSVLEMFLLGVILALEGKKAKTPVLLIILLAVTVLAEAASSIAVGSSFHYLDVWRSSLIALSGYLSASLLN